MKRSRLELLKTTTETVHIISTPFGSEQGRSLALKVAKACERSDPHFKEFCYNPNEDCPQTLGVGWLDTWMAICDNTVRTGGKVFVIFRSDGQGRYGCDQKGPKSLDGQAQPGEIMHALSKGCDIHWMDSTNPEAAMLELQQVIDEPLSERAVGTSSDHGMNPRPPPPPPPQHGMNPTPPPAVRPPFHRQSSLNDKVKRAIVRIGLFDTSSKTVLTVGSGVVIKGACGPCAQILTCAHNFLDTGTTPHQYLFGLPPEQVIILVGIFTHNDQSSIWRYRAELVTPQDLLMEMTSFNNKPSRALLDLAVLRVVRDIEIRPPRYQGLSMDGTPQPTYELEVELPVYAAESPCDLKKYALELGDPERVDIGTSISAGGWYSEQNETTLFMLTDFKIMGVDPSGLFISNTVLHSGGSGGPQLDNNGNVVAINSMSGKEYIVDSELHQKTYGRKVSMLQPRHGLVE